MVNRHEVTCERRETLCEAIRDMVNDAYYHGELDGHLRELIGKEETSLKKEEKNYIEAMLNKIEKLLTD